MTQRMINYTDDELAERIRQAAALRAAPSKPPAFVREEAERRAYECGPQLSWIIDENGSQESPPANHPTQSVTSVPLPQAVGTHRPVPVEPGVPTPLTEGRGNVGRSIRYAAFFAIAFSVAILLVILVPKSPGAPPHYPARSESAGSTLGPENVPGDGARVIRWSLPSNLQGYVSYLVVRPDGTSEVRPRRDDLCENVADLRGNDEIKSSLSFGTDTRGETIVWLVLTERPAAEALAAAVGARPGDDLRGPHLPQTIVTEFETRGMPLRATGRVVIPPAPTERKSNP